MLKTMEKMEAEWAGLDFKVMPYKDTGEEGGKGGGQGVEGRRWRSRVLLGVILCKDIQGCGVGRRGKGVELSQRDKG